MRFCCAIAGWAAAFRTKSTKTRIETSILGGNSCLRIWHSEQNPLKQGLKQNDD